MFRTYIATFLVYGLIQSSVAATVPLSDEVWHDMGSHSKFGYEWWYFDLQNHDGNQVSIAFLTPNPYDIRIARHLFLDPSAHHGVLVQAGLIDGTRFDIQERTHGKNKFQFSPDPFEVKIANSWFRMRDWNSGFPRYTLSIDIYDSRTKTRARGEIEFSATAPGWRHEDGILYQNSENRDEFHKWIVPVPRARVTGTITLTDASGRSYPLAIDADGYHDHNYGSVAMPSTSDGWYWGRGETDTSTFIFSKLWGKRNVSEPYNLVVFLDDQNVYLDTKEAEVLDSEPGTADNGMPYKSQFAIRAHNPGDSTEYTFQVHSDRITYAGLPWYVRQATQMTSQCSNPTLPQCALQNGNLVLETLDLKRLTTWFLKIFFDPRW